MVSTPSTISTSVANKKTCICGFAVATAQGNHIDVFMRLKVGQKRLKQLDLSLSCVVCSPLIRSLLVCTWKFYQCFMYRLRTAVYRLQAALQKHSYKRYRFIATYYYIHINKRKVHYQQIRQDHGLSKSRYWLQIKTWYTKDRIKLTHNMGH